MRKKLAALLICCLLAFSILTVNAPEDISVFTEVDPNNHIDYDATTVNFTYYCNEDAYLYNDSGVGYFENFSHQIDANWLSKSGSSFQRSMIWMVSNDLDSAKGLDDNSKDFLGLCFTYTASAHYIQLIECDGGVLTIDPYFPASLNTWYYFDIYHFKGDNITAEIYSNYARTNLLDTLTISGIFSTTFRYIHVANSWNNGQNRWGTTRHMNLTYFIPDRTSPDITYMGLNSTLSGQTGLFTFNLTDNIALSHLVFSWNNSGTMVNHTSAISGTNTIASYTGTINGTAGVIVEYRAFWNDTSDNWGSIILHYFEVNTGADYEWVVAGFFLILLICIPGAIIVFRRIS